MMRFEVKENDHNVLIIAADKVTQGDSLELRFFKDSEWCCTVAPGWVYWRKLEEMPA